MGFAVPCSFELPVLCSFSADAGGECLSLRGREGELAVFRVAGAAQDFCLTQLLL